MGFELREIDAAESGTYICAPQLEVAGTSISTIELDEITLVQDGYTRKDSIITIKLKTSIRNDDDTYPLEKNFLYEFINGDNVEYFRITSFFEQSSVTYIKIYSTKTILVEFFGALVAKALDNYEMEIYDNFKVSRLDECVAPNNINFFGVTSSSIKIKPIVDFTFIDEWNIRYRKNGQTSWIEVYNIKNSEYELQNLESNTVYEMDICIKCNISSEYSDYSEIFLFRTL